MARFFTPAWIVRHLLAVVLTVGFCGLGVWQLGRASGGNTLSWAYTFEWPIFAIFTAALWVREVRAELRMAGPGPVESEPPLVSPFDVVVTDTAEPASTGDDATDAYNRYLAWLSENPDRLPSQYPSNLPGIAEGTGALDAKNAG